MPTTDATAPPLIDPQVLLQIQSLELRARHVVEGFLAGLHRSPYHGSSVEFTEYREYAPGDDPRRLDWRLFARSDRYYVKRYEDETNLRSVALLDASRSMAFGSSFVTKYDYARTLVASLGYFLRQQRDALGLGLFSAGVDEWLPPSARISHWRRLIAALERPPTGAATSLSEPLEQLAQRFSKRGLVVLVSDLLAPLERVEYSLGSLVARGHEVLVFQILDPAETTLEFPTPEQFEDLESGKRLYVDPRAVGSEYRRRFGEHQQALTRIVERLGVTMQTLTTRDALGAALAGWLRARLHPRDVGRASPGGRRR